MKTQSTGFWARLFDTLDHMAGGNLDNDPVLMRLSAVEQRLAKLEQEHSNPLTH